MIWINRLPDKVGRPARRILLVLLCSVLSTLHYLD